MFFYFDISLLTQKLYSHYVYPTAINIPLNYLSYTIINNNNNNNQALIPNFRIKYESSNKLVIIDYMYYFSPFYYIQNHSLYYFLNSLLLFFITSPND